MKFIKKSIPDIILIKPKVHTDQRGYFVETFRQNEFDDTVGHKINFCQHNETKSQKGVLRGLHFQLPPFAQSKLVSVIKGEVLDVCVDIRHGSPTFGHHVSELLSDENKHQLFIPRGFAHGFVVLSEWAIFSYKVDNYYSTECDAGLAFDDSTLSIDWVLPPDQLKLSDKDLNQPSLKMINKQCFRFDYKKNLYE